MSSQASTGKPEQRRRSIWIGRVLSAFPVLMMSFSAVMKLIRPPQVVQIFSGIFGYPAGTLVPIGVVELSCAILYLIPQTAVIGAVLVTTYLGGAVATHVRIGDPSWWQPALLGVFAWLGLYLRDARLRELLPIRKPASSTSRAPRPGTTA